MHFIYAISASPPAFLPVIFLLPSFIFHFGLRFSMNSETIFILSFIVIISMYYKSNFTRLGLIRIALLIFLLLISVLTPQFVDNTIFLSGEQQGHFLEMTICTNYESLSFIESFKSFAKLLSCHLDSAALFDLLYKLTFLLACLFLIFISQRPLNVHHVYIPNPVIPIVFGVYPLIYGANRSCLASLSIVCSFLLFSKLFAVPKYR